MTLQQDCDDRYRRIDSLLQQRVRDFPLRLEPTWTRLDEELGELAAVLRERVLSAPGSTIPLDRQMLARPVFIVGYPKSGTTLLLSLLDAHPQLVVIPGETRWFTDPEPTFAELHDRWIRYLINPSGQDPTWLLGRPSRDADPYLGFTRTLAALAAAHPDLDLLVLLAATFSAGASGARAWLEKTPLHLFQVERIRRRFPAARFIQVVRDPRATVASISHYARHGWGTDLDETTAGMVAALEQAREAPLELGSSTYLVVRYEDVVTAPEHSLTRVAEFIGIDWADSLLRPTLAGVPVRANSAWLERRVLGEIQDRSLRTAELDGRTLAIVQARASEPARALGYSLPRVGRMRALAVEVEERARRLARRAVGDRAGSFG